MEAVAQARVERPAAEVWALVADFCHLSDWHPWIAESAPAPHRAPRRELLTTDGTRLSEELLHSDAAGRVLEYCSVTHPFPVRDYLARVEVQAQGTAACLVRWSVRFEALEGDGAAQRDLFTDTLLTPGLDALAHAPAARVPEEAAALGLDAHPEGGWFRETYRSDVPVTTEHGERVCATAIQYLLGPGEQSAWHRVRHDELWLWQHGGRLTLERGGTGAAPCRAERVLLGPDAGGAGGLFQDLIPAGTWQRAEPAEGRAVLVACVVAPGFDYADFEMPTETAPVG